MLDEHRELLVRYMAQVISVEGTSFVQNQSHDITLTESETEELLRIEEEARKEYGL